METTSASAPARPAFFSSSSFTPKAVAIMAKSRNMPPPISAIPLKSVMSESPFLPPVSSPPSQASSRPAAMAIAEL